jgi:hypothetical protein
LLQIVFFLQKSTIRLFFKHRNLGSTSGIGQTAALRYAEQGACVTLHGRNEQRMKVSLYCLS